MWNSGKHLNEIICISLSTYLGLKNMLLIWYFVHLPLLSWNIFTLLFALVSDKSGNNSRKGSPTRPNKTKYKETLKQTNKNYLHYLMNCIHPRFIWAFNLWCQLDKNSENIPCSSSMKSHLCEIRLQKMFQSYTYGYARYKMLTKWCFWTIT